MADPDCSVIGVAVVLERVFWWGGRWMRRDPKRIEKVSPPSRSAMSPKLPACRAIRATRSANDVERIESPARFAPGRLASGCRYRDQAGRPVPRRHGHLVTLAPLLGLLGTITGLIKSFSFLGNEELAVHAVTGGIAEALIATACGLGIAIFALIPFNFFTSRVSNLEFELQTAATNLEVMLEAQNKASETWQIRDGNRQLGHPIVNLGCLMNVSSPIPHKKARIEIIPLIDIMFFLLASFMMVSLSQVHMKGMKVNLPTGASGETQSKKRLHQRLSKRAESFFDKEEINYDRLTAI